MPAVATGLVDRFGRVATDLRVSLTDRCNLRCTYCMPAEGLAWLPKEEVAHRRRDRPAGPGRGGAAGRHGGAVHRRRAADPARAGRHRARRCAALTPRPRLSLTTNGIGLARLAAPLQGGRARPGQRLARHPRPGAVQDADPPRPADDVLDGLAAAAAAGLTPVKVNSVLMRGVNDDEAAELLRFALAHGYELRFIEQMPLDAQHGWDRATMVTAEEILASLRGELHAGARPGRPRRRAGRDVAGRRQRRRRVGIIGSVTRPFCGDCDRTRLTADGQIRNCLFATEESDLRRRCAAAPTTRSWPGAGGPRCGPSARPRHRRPDVPAARPADVGDRRLTCDDPPSAYFAGARAAAGVAEESVPAGLTRDDLVERAHRAARRTAGRRAQGGQLPASTGSPGATVAPRCRPAPTVDVLPPFAGG